MSEEKEVKNKKGWKIVSKVLTSILLVCLVCFFFIRIYLNSNYVCRFISGSSMEPTFSGSAGQYEYLYMKKVKEKTKIQRFDIVAVHINKDSSGQYLDWIKRIIGLPNETIKYQQGQLYVNDVLMQENFIHKNYFHAFDYEVTLNENQYFIIGDNRKDSTKAVVERTQIYGINGFIFKTCNQGNKMGSGIFEKGCKITYKKIN